jgi:MarR family transcriptional regulator, organic hydroperoxide resistance regulator
MGRVVTRDASRRMSGWADLDKVRVFLIILSFGANMMTSDRKLPVFLTKTEWPYYWISRVNGRYALELEKVLKPIGLDMSRWRVLSALLEHGRLGVSEIAEHCLLKLNTTTKIVQRMVADGLVVTRGSRIDGRVTEVSLTEDGERQGRRARQLAQQLFERSCVDIDLTELAQLNMLLKKVFDGLEG